MSVLIIVLVALLLLTVALIFFVAGTAYTTGKTVKWWLKFHPDIASTDIQKRYNTYNELFWKVRAKRGNDTGD